MATKSRALAEKISGARSLMQAAIDDVNDQSITDAIRELHAAQLRIIDATTDAVRLARWRGVPWSAIGRALDLTPQGAQQRYAEPAAAKPAALPPVQEWTRVRADCGCLSLPDGFTPCDRHRASYEASHPKAIKA